MNCEQGDLARYVGRDPLCYGYIVKCLRIHPMSPPDMPCWVTDPPMPHECGIGFSLAVADAVLRPIRPGDGEDEMLRIAGKPERRDESLKPRRQVENAR